MKLLLKMIFLGTYPNRLKINFLSIIALWAMVSSAELEPVYEECRLINISSPKSDVIVLREGEQVRQSFRPIPKNIVLPTLLMKDIMVYINFFPGNEIDIDFTIYKGDIQSKKVLYTKKVTHWKEFMNFSAGIYRQKEPQSICLKVISLENPLPLTFGQQYTLEIKVNKAERPLRLALTKEPYFEGQCEDRTDDLWVGIVGEVTLAQTKIVVKADPENHFYFDNYSAGEEKKVLGVGGDPEKLTIHRYPKIATYSYRISDPQLASVSVSKSTGKVDDLKLVGLKEGITSLEIIVQDKVVKVIDLHIFNRRKIVVSYQYIAYPEESNHSFRSPFCAVLSPLIKEVYNRANIEVEIVDNGEIVFDWDLDGNGNSYSVDQSEVNAINALPKHPNRYFTNFMVYRQNKQDDYVGGSNGGGTSVGFGEKDDPPRYGDSSIHLFRLPQSIADTLAHELGHNLGLVHYTSNNANEYFMPNQLYNIMKVGHKKGNYLFSDQWEKIHDTLRQRALLGENITIIPPLGTASN